MCECYQIGGRFIAEDPECPIHGHEADRLRRDGMSDADAIAILREHGSFVLGTDSVPLWMIEAVQTAARRAVDAFIEQC